ncbi:Snf7-domain-containing protein [Xylaria palmicola]|nr:Snf7-domain-containing protein [Xylaria palmicola]
MSELLDYLLQNDQNFRKARLPSLYSDFRSQRTLNPDGFAANVSAWERGLASGALAGRAPSRSASARNHLTLELDDALLRALESKQFGRPLALGAALQDALATGEMMTRPQFLRAAQSVYRRSWGRVPWALAGWALRQVGLLGGPGDAMPPRGQVVVVLQNLEVVARAFADATADRTAPFERIFSRAHFRRTFEAGLLEEEGQRLSDDDFEVLIKFLARDKGVLATDGHTVKIKAPSEPDAISDEDAAIASLRELTEELTRQTEALGRRVDELGAAALDAVRRKNRVAATAALRSKKAAEASLATRHATLGQLEAVAAQMQQAADNVQLVRVMEASAGALRGLNAQVGGADRVDAVLDDLREQMGRVDEVGNVIAEVGAAPVDEEVVDDEFEALLADERRKEEEAERAGREAREAREAEETRRKLAELERLGPTTETEEEGNKRPLSPVTAAADVLGGMHLDSADDVREKEQEAAKMPAA